MALGREEEAQACMEKYQRIRPQGLPGLRTRMGMIDLATLSAPEQREHQIERFRGEAGEHPDRPSYQLRLSSLLLADGRKEEALREFGRLLELNANGQVLEQAGALLLASGEYSLAHKFLQRAAGETPSARLNLAIAIFHTDGPRPALEYLDKIPAGELTVDEGLLKANILEAAGRKAEATKTLDQSLSRVPTKPASVQRAVLMLIRLDRKADALKLLEQSIRANPQDSDLPLAKAVVLGMMERILEAEKTLREIELRWPEWDRAYLAHGLLLEGSARPGEARQKLQISATLGSRDPSLRCALARLERTPNPAPECACLTGLEQVLLPDCAHQR
jgi:tetratricopeptide (TPR) repeat protein